VPTLSSLTPLAPVLAAFLGALLVVAVRLRQQTVTSAAWILWAGVVGGSIASLGLSAEWLNAGTGGYVVSAVGGVAGAALMTMALMGLGGPRMWRDPEQPTSILAWWRSERRSRWRRPDPRGRSLTTVHSLGTWVATHPVACGVALLVAGTAVLFAVAGLGWVGVLLLLLVAAVGLTTFGWSVTTGFLVLAAISSALVVVASELLLTRFGWVGHAVPVTVLVAVFLLPLIARAGIGSTWSTALRRVDLLDVAVVTVAATAGLTWWNLLHGLGPDGLVAQLIRVGEDNLSHLIMLGATRDSGTVLGGSDASVAAAARFADYFTGSSSWQASVGGLVGSDSAPAAYLMSSVVLLAMLAGLAASVATLAAPRRRPRLCGVTALGVVAVGVVATRATLAMYELGFPGQLLVATFVVVALLLLVRNGSPVVSLLVLALLALATWWTWSLAALVLAVPMAVLALQIVRRGRWVPDRVLASVIAVGAVVGVLGIVLKRARITAILDELNLEGAIFRGIPTWVAFLLVLALPLALQLGRRRVPLPATALVLSACVATLALASWQVVRVGTMTYYGYKLEYFVLALGWGIGSLSIATVVRRHEARSALAVRVGAAALAVVAAVPMVSWIDSNYQGWLTARGALGTDPAMVCAIGAARGLPEGSVAIATGFGEPISNYLTTRAMDVGTGNTGSSVLWGPILSVPDPATWPWVAVQAPIVIVEGPSATPEQTRSLLTASSAAGVSVAEKTTCATRPAG
jgi:hypothetical protein